MAFEPDFSYDVIVIGAGIGGLVSAGILSRCGLKVALLEKEPHVGGYLAGYQKKGFRFDTAIHWRNQCSPTGAVSKIFSILGDDYPHCGELKKIRLNKSDHDEYLITNTPDDLKDALTEKFPPEKNGIDRFFRDSYLIGRSLDKFGKYIIADEVKDVVPRYLQKLTMLRYALPFIKFLPYSGKRFQKGLEKYFTNSELQKMFSPETDLLSCIVPIGWAYFNDYQTPPQGGGQTIPEWLQHVAKSAGCAIHLNSTVEKISLKDGMVKNVSVKKRNNEFHIATKYVIAACDLNSVYENLLPVSTIDEKYIERLKDAELYSSSFTLSIALDCPSEELGFGEEMIHLFHEDVAKDEHNSGDPETSALTILAPSIRDKTLAPEGCGTLVVFMPAYFNQYNNWQTGPASERGAAYEALKKEIAEKLISRVEAIAPDIRKHIIFSDAATPITHWRYTNNRFGTMMGAKPGKKNMQTNVATYKTPVKNLFVGGHWAELGGGVPIAAKAGLNAALLVLKKEKSILFKELCNYLEGKTTREKYKSDARLKTYNNDWTRNPTAAEKLKGILKIK